MNGRNPTKEESDWMAAVIDLGCIVCRNALGLFSLCEIHHLEGSKKPGAHLKTIGLCFPHHRGGYDSIECISRHTNKYRFQLKYGSEKSLLEQTKKIIGDQS